MWKRGSGHSLLLQTSPKDHESVPRKERGQPITTPDGRYIVVRGRLWRAANPEIEATVRQDLVNELMAARRAVGSAKGTGNADELAKARGRVQSAKERLGERGEVWWTDGARDLNRTLAKNSPYAEWWASVLGQAP
jgi:hypothetical protein